FVAGGFVHLADLAERNIWPRQCEFANVQPLVRLRLERVTDEAREQEVVSCDEHACRHRVSLDVGSSIGVLNWSNAQLLSLSLISVSAPLRTVGNARRYSEVAIPRSRHSTSRSSVACHTSSTRPSGVSARMSVRQSSARRTACSGCSPPGRWCPTGS